MKYKELLSMIDTYSLGILIPFLFIDYNQTKYIKKSPFLKELFNLFGEMCEVNHEKKIKPDKCLKQYYELIKNNSSLEKGSKQKKPKFKKTMKKQKKKLSYKIYSNHNN